MGKPGKKASNIFQNSGIKNNNGITNPSIPGIGSPLKFEVGSNAFPKYAQWQKDRDNTVKVKAESPIALNGKNKFKAAAKKAVASGANEAGAEAATHVGVIGDPAQIEKDKATIIGKRAAIQAKKDSIKAKSAMTSKQKIEALKNKKYKSSADEVNPHNTHAAATNDPMLKTNVEKKIVQLKTNMEKKIKESPLKNRRDHDLDATRSSMNKDEKDAYRKAFNQAADVGMTIAPVPPVVQGAKIAKGVSTLVKGVKNFVGQLTKHGFKKTKTLRQAGIKSTEDLRYADKSWTPHLIKKNEPKNFPGYRDMDHTVYGPWSSKRGQRRSDGSRI
tara:strand:- start:167 stop:1159 length:993 start_codon:yes stop_codon:yes gene_type:complete